MNDEDDIYNAGYNDGYSLGQDHARLDALREHDKEMSDILFEHEYKLECLQNDFDKKFEVLISHLRLKDSEIEEHLTQIQELRKANEELQRIIKTNSR